MLEHTHVPIHPCWVIVWSRFGAISEVGGGGEDVGARGVRLYLRRGVVGVQLDFTWGGVSVELEQSSANIARTHAMVSTQSFIGNS